MIPYNKPSIIGNELSYIKEAIETGKLSGDGPFTFKCHKFFEEKYNFPKVFLTTSCTHALEISALLAGIKPGDEVIMPSYTFVSTANAFVLRGAKIVFADCEEQTPNIDAGKLEELINERTKAVVVVHYSGVACDMDVINALAKKHNLFVIEDAAHAIDSFYKGKPLGSFGQFSAFSFHETKNIVAGEGGMFVINDLSFKNRTEIIREKGTNRSSFYRGEVDKYGWIDIGSSYLPSELIAAFLYGQLELIDKIQNKRKEIWNEYYQGLQTLEEAGLLKLPYIHPYATNNGHIFYLLCKSLQERTEFIDFMKAKAVSVVFHYLPLHSSPYYKDKHDGRELPNADRYSDCLVRLPLFYELTKTEISYIVNCIKEFYLN
jgi:dTDP-4-amino-4,6-dideoxygalactose transaminase